MPEPRGRGEAGGRARRFVVRPDAVTAGRVRFDREETRHITRVLRLRPGALIEAVDGTGGILAVRLDGFDRDGAHGTLLGPGLRDGAPTGESACAITLAQAVLRGERMGWLVEKVTELGVTRILPLLTERVVARPAEPRRARWERLAREAVKQCRRSVTPVVEPPRDFDAALAEIARHDVTWLLVEAGAPPLGEAARKAGRPRRLLLLVGPEGGFTPTEAAAAEAAGARPVGLGPRILRGESAGLVAVALGQHWFGDLGSIGAGAP